MGTWDIIRVTLDPEGKWKWLRHPKSTTWGFPIHIHWSIILFMGPYWWSHYSILLMVNDSITHYISINPSHQSFMVISSTPWVRVETWDIMGHICLTFSHLQLSSLFKDHQDRRRCIGSRPEKKGGSWIGASTWCSCTLESTAGAWTVVGFPRV
jgi:hypothetical protein